MPTRRTSVKPQERERDNFLFALGNYLDTSLTVPDVIEFSMSSEYIGRPLYPLQGTMLKVAFLQTEIMTAYDLDVIDYWSNMFAQTGNNGCQPDLLERIKINKDQGNKWFKEWISIIGRRGSKGFLGGVGASYVLYHYLQKGNPQEYYGVTYDKRMTMYVFAGKKEQAKVNQWSDVVNVIKGATCFAPYLPEKPLSESLVVYAPNDFIRIADRQAMGQYPRLEDMATFEILPKESTVMAARGTAAFALLFDEFAWITRTTAKADSTELYDSAIPALDQFKEDAWIYEGSSAWQMIGQLYENWQLSQAHSDGSDGKAPGTILRPDMLMFQLTSWDPYIDWQRSNTISLTPQSNLQAPRPQQYTTNTFYSTNTTYPKFRVAMQEYDEALQMIEASNPETFQVERRSYWATVLDAYLNPDRVEAMFEPWIAPWDSNNNIQNESFVTVGHPHLTYVGHADPGAVNDNFALVIAHAVMPPVNPFSPPGSPVHLPHVVFDYITHWEPASFVDNNWEVDYEIVLGQMKNILYRFMPEQFSFDQGGSSVWMQQQLRKWVAEVRMIKPVTILQRTATKVSNWNQAEVFKTALNMGLLHSAPYTQAREELLFIQKSAPDKVEAPTTGPVQHDDVAISLFNVVDVLLGEHLASMVGAMMPNPLGAALGGLPLPPVTPESRELTESRIMALRKSNKPTLGVYNPGRGTRFSRPTGPGSKGRRF